MDTATSELRKPALAIHPVGPSTYRSRGWLAAGTLVRREFIRFMRQRHRVFGALGQPILFLLLFGAGLRGSFEHPLIPGSTYAEFFYPGALILMVLFTAIFATISIIEDRTQGFLQSVLVAPAPAWSIAVGKILGATALALAQGLVLLAGAPFLGVPFHVLGWLGALFVMAVVGVAMSAVGFLFAWRMDSVQGYHGVMNVLLIPMWLLSGAMFPAVGAAPWMRVVMAINPLTYGTAALRQMLYLGEPQMAAGLPSLMICMTLLLGFTAVVCSGAIWVAGRPRK